MARPKPKKKADPQPPPQPSMYRVLPIQLKPGDRLADESGEWEVLGRPYSTAGGKNVHVRVQRVGGGTQVVRLWGAHEKVSVRRPGRIE